MLTLHIASWGLPQWTFASYLTVNVVETLVKELRLCRNGQTPLLGVVGILVSLSVEIGLAYIAHLGGFQW